MAISKEVLAKWQGLDPLSDLELKQLLEYFARLQAALDGYCPPEYRLFRNDVNKHVERLTDGIDLRKKS